MWRDTQPAPCIYMATRFQCGAHNILLMYIKHSINYSFFFALNKHCFEHFFNFFFFNLMQILCLKYYRPDASPKY